MNNIISDDHLDTVCIRKCLWVWNTRKVRFQLCKNNFFDIWWHFQYVKKSTACKTRRVNEWKIEGCALHVDDRFVRNAVFKGCEDRCDRDRNEIKEITDHQF
jgi:hypothetical protein